MSQIYSTEIVTVPLRFGVQRIINVNQMSPEDCDIWAFVKSQKFIDWLADYEHEGLVITDINVKSTLFVKRDDQKILLFATFTQIVTEARTGKPVPGFTFMRGPAAAFLTVIKVKGRDIRYTIITHQARAPIGKASFPECPAGMLDNNKVLESLAKEMNQELKQTLEGADVVPLGKSYPSPGGCDEVLELYMVEYELELDKILQMNAKWELENEFGLQGRETGEEKENESIRLEFIPLWQLATKCREDAKAQMLLFNLMMMMPNERILR